MAGLQAEAGEAPPAKKFRVADSKYIKLQDKLTNDMDLILKMNLFQAQRLRGLTNAPMETIRVSADLNLITCTKDAVTQYVGVCKYLEVGKERIEKLKD